MVQFGIQIESQFGFTYEKIKTIALECEALGFDSIWCSDHFFRNLETVNQSCLDCWTVLAALAVDTQRIRLGSLVTCVSFRHPSVLAKIAASVDVISRGRLEFGIGAGWKAIEYRAYGIPFPPPSVRVEQLSEGIQIIKKMWTEEKATFSGKHYHVTDAICAPKPLQRPHPKIWVGGAGKRVLGVAAELGDGINIRTSPTAQVYAEKLETLKQHCRDLGRRYDQIVKSHLMDVIIAKDEAQLEYKLQRLTKESNRPLEYLKARRPGAFMGTPEGFIEYLRQYIAMGVSHLIFVFPYEAESESLQILGEEVLPKFK